MNSDGTPLTRRLTNNSASDTDPFWSPDGAKIVFTSRRDGNTELYVMDASGDNKTRLTNNPGDDSRPTWSPDGAKIAFVQQGLGIYVMNADGTAVTRNTEAFDVDPDWQAVSVDPTPTPMTIQFASAVASVWENGVSATVTVSRLGNNSGVATVDYATSDLGGLVATCPTLMLLLHVATMKPLSAGCASRLAKLLRRSQFLSLMILTLKALRASQSRSAMLQAPALVHRAPPQ